MNVFGSYMILFGSDLILFGSCFKFQEISVMLVATLINFGVKNQVPQASFKIVVGDLISFLTFGSDMNLFGSDMIFSSICKFHDPLFMLVSNFTSFGVTNQVLQVSFKLVAWDLMLVSSYEFADIMFCEYCLFMKIYNIMDLNNSLSMFPRFLYLSI